MTITGRGLEIGVPADAGSLGSRANTLSGGTITGLLGQVTVDDSRNGGSRSGWVVSVSSTAFTSTGRPPIAASWVSYVAGAVAKTGTGTVVANNPNNLASASPAVTASGLTGSNTATWNPLIRLSVPGSTVVGVYAAVITHSVL